MIDENKLRKVALSMIDNCQKDIDIMAKREEFIYSIGYNDGVLDMLDALLRELSEKRSKSDADND